MKNLSFRSMSRTGLRCLTSLRSVAFAAMTFGVFSAWSTPASAQLPQKGKVPA